MSVERERPDGDGGHLWHEASIPPLTPLFLGSTTRNAKSPEPSYYLYRQHRPKADIQSHVDQFINGSRRNGNFQDAVPLVGKQVVSRLNVVQLEAMGDQRSQIDPA